MCGDKTSFRAFGICWSNRELKTASCLLPQGTTGAAHDCRQVVAATDRKQGYISEKEDNAEQKQLQDLQSVPSSIHCDAKTAAL